MKILILGGGGREHALALKISENKNVSKIYCAPGNGGTALMSICENVNLEKKEELRKFAKENEINLTVVGPEKYLVEGIVDYFKEEGLKIFGPSKKASMLEGSKAFSKDFMKKYKVKTAEYEVFYSMDKALEYLKGCNYPIVIKADGLAAGKGVVICEDLSKAEKTLDDFMVKDIFKGSGKKIVIEEFLKGVEASILAITDGENIVPFLSAKDHKNIYDNDKGPNTGGMGAICPNPYCNKNILDEFEKNILTPTLRGIKEEKFDYKGFLFFGIMITDKGIYLLEYNVRLGDPETQVVLPLMKSDLVDLINETLDNNLHNFKLEWKEKHSCCVVASSKGYPGNYETGFNIEGFEDILDNLFIAGAKVENKTLKTSGGRVLCTYALGDSLDEARILAYEKLKKINFEGMYFRKDIGK